VRNIFLYALVALSLTCCGQGDNNTTRQPTTTDTISPMRPVPLKPAGWVSDFDSLFTPAEAKQLDSIIAQYEKETTNEIAIVTYEFPPGQLEDAGGLEKFSLALFNRWGVGKKEKNNGIALLVLNSEKKVRIEVGRGLEEKLTNDEAKRVIDELIIPEFKKGNYYSGVLNGLQAIMREIK
jgi:uncharacterized protein